MHSYCHSAAIQMYPAMSLAVLADYTDRIVTQAAAYAFVPLSVVYDKDTDADQSHTNHWAALIIDKAHAQVFYLDPARKTAIPPAVVALCEQHHVSKTVTCNPIDFQRSEKVDGWVRHCGPYVVEIFRRFYRYYTERSAQPIAGSHLADPAVANSCPVQTVLSDIPCGAAEASPALRQAHITDTMTYLTEHPVHEAGRIATP
ncbi:MAG: hypothetical protein AAGD05_12755 [Bacteroidota bacterium]